MRIPRPLRRWLGERRLRITSGLVIFSYVTLHFLNHAAGNISIAAMETAVHWQTSFWQTWPATVVLYAAILIHPGLGLWAFYARRHHGWVAGEIWQLGLGLTIPPLIMSHIVGTRLSQAVFDTWNGYGQVLARLWILDPVHGLQQMAVLVIAWVHGCIGLYYWLRLRRWFRAVAPVLLGLAVAVPLLALLGFYRGGIEIRTLFPDPEWRAENWVAAEIGTPAQAMWLQGVWQGLMGVYFGLIALVLVARGVRTWREQRRGGVTVSYPGGRRIRVPLGYSVLEASRAAGIAHASVCGGRGRCSTCRVQVVAGEAGLAVAAVEEAAVLLRIGAGPSVRLACQLRPRGDVTVVPLLPAHGTVAPGGRRGLGRGPEERFIVVMVVDMRNSTGMAEHRMPFDTVFIVDRFVDAIGRAIKAAGGRVNQFTGDGVFALFGLEVGPAAACRQAVAAVAEIGRNVAAMNAALGAAPGVPVRFGIGVQGGTAVVGEIGFDTSRIFTALGDPANVASRLEKLCKTWGAEAVVAEEVCRAGGLGGEGARVEMVEVAGRGGALEVRVVAKAALLF